MLGSRSLYGTSALCTESRSPPGQVCTPMLRRSSAEKRAKTRLSSSMKWASMPRPVHGLRGSLRVASRPSVKSIDTRVAPAAKACRMSFSHSSTRSDSNCSRG